MKQYVNYIAFMRTRRNFHNRKAYQTRFELTYSTVREKNIIRDTSQTRVLRELKSVRDL